MERNTDGYNQRHFLRIAVTRPRDRAGSTDGWPAWRRLFWAMVIGTISNASLWTTVALMPSLQADFALTRTEASYPYIVTMLGFLIGNPFLGRWSDRFGITPVLMAATILSSLAYAGAALAQNFTLFLLTQLLIGIGTSAGFAPLTADVSHWFVRRRGLAVALASCAGYLSGVLWTTVIARVLQWGDWRDAHIIIAVALTAIVPLALLLRQRVPDHILEAADRAAARKAQGSGLTPGRTKWLLAAAGTGCCIAMAMPQVHIVSLCTDLGFTLAQGNTLLSVILAGGIVSRIVSGALTDRIGAIRVLLIGSALQMLAMALYIPQGGLASLYVVSLVFGLAQGGILPAYPMIVRDYLPARSAGAAIGTVSMATQFGMAFGGWLSGWIYDQTGSYLMAFVNGLAWNGLNIGLIGFLLWRVQASRKALPVAEATR